VSADLAQFRDGFLADSFEALDSMERSLLRLTPGAADREHIHTIFRAAHSIKSGAGMFAFEEIVDFTHTLEALLDELRAGRMQVTTAICDGLLESVDQLRAMLTATQQRQPIDLGRSRVLQSRLKAIVAAGDIPVWKIHFKPLPGLQDCGVDPQQIAADLAGMGVLTSQSEWEFTLATTVPRDSIELIFEWAEGNCELSIERVDPARITQQVELPVAMPEPAAAASDNTIRVAVLKLDEMLHVADEAATAQSMLSELVSGLEGPQAQRLQAGLDELESRLRELQESVMRVRMLPVATVFRRLPRLVRDLSARLGKQIQLQVAGEGTELDKNVLEAIGDSLVHLVRNSVDHGIEMPDVRTAAGKPAEGTIQLQAFQEGGSVHIVLSDDGKGLDRDRLLHKARHSGLLDNGAELSDEQVQQLIFLPGLSTSDQATDVSGRGVGMDVVRRNAEKLGGQVAVRSEPGRGTSIHITLPLTQPAGQIATSARNCA
jgi:two-component system chemotaxis sensor kinase CheA